MGVSALHMNCKILYFTVDSQDLYDVRSCCKRFESVINVFGFIISFQLIIHYSNKTVTSCNDCDQN